MCVCSDNQDVGLEAAIHLRVRNSSWSVDMHDNIQGLSSTEAADQYFCTEVVGEAFCTG